MKKDKILIIVFLLLLASSGLVLFRGFRSETFSSVETPTSSNDDVAKTQAEAVKSKITNAINKIDTGGSLDTLIQSQQFKDLFLVEGQGETDLPVQVVTTTTIGDYGRPNPFLVPTLLATTTKPKK